MAMVEVVGKWTNWASRNAGVEDSAANSTKLICILAASHVNGVAHMALSSVTLPAYAIERISQMSVNVEKYIVHLQGRNIVTIIAVSAGVSKYGIAESESANA